MTKFFDLEENKPKKKVSVSDYIPQNKGEEELQSLLDSIFKGVEEDED